MADTDFFKNEEKKRGKLRVEILAVLAMMAVLGIGLIALSWRGFLHDEKKTVFAATHAYTLKDLQRGYIALDGALADCQKGGTVLGVAVLGMAISLFVLFRKSMGKGS